MVIVARSVTILDPTVEAIPSGTLIARRPDTLNGVTVGLLANGKPNSDKLLDFVGQLLQQRYQISALVARNKGNASRPAPAPIVDELARQCGVVITATGD
ncbi:MAG: hypothetical protein HYU29_07100 [Chloroflexi bacterium]|nr:hypothetical protein [Chloroflexota bacterium]